MPAALPSPMRHRHSILAAWVTPACGAFLILWAVVVGMPLALVIASCTATAVISLLVIRGLREREAAEASARELFQHLPLPATVFEATTLRFLDANDAAAAFYGYSREELLRMSVRDLRRPDDLAGLEERVREFPNRSAYRSTHVRKDGALVQVEISIRAFVFGGKDARLAVAKDVTAREEAEAARRILEERFTRLSECGILGVTITNQADEIIEANDTFLRTTGYSRLDLERRTLRWDAITPPEWLHINEIIIRMKAAQGFAGPIEKEYLRKDGTRVPVIVGVALLENGTSLTFILDVTERKRLDELLTENRRAQESSRLKSEFLANMSHELRTPLNAIIGFTEMVHDGEMGPVSAGQRECLESALVSSRHLLQLINDILDLAKVEAGRLDLHPERVELQKTIAEVVATQRPVMLQRGQRIQVEVDPALRDVHLDGLRLKQVLYNYLSNALKFSHEGGEIAVRARPEGAGAFRIEVEDHGVGIQAGDLPRLFTDFTQLDSGYAKQYEGTGLGLALTKRLVEAQGGSVGVRSDFGSGSVFHAILPLSASGDECRAKAS